MSVVVQPIEYGIARCRIALSLTAMIAIFVDPTQPLLNRWMSLHFGPFEMDPLVSVALLVHLSYSLTVLRILRADVIEPPRLASVTMWADVTSGAVMAALTEGVSSPMYAFVVFAVIAVGLTSGFRRAMLVTTISVVFYLSLIAVSASGSVNFFIMRPVYLGITGYLVGYLGEQRLKLEAGIRELAMRQQRQRIARDLHDGRAQAFAAINLHLASCHRLLQEGLLAPALAELSNLRMSVNREYDELRMYMRSLAGLDGSVTMTAAARNVRLTLSVDLDGSTQLIDPLLQILREGVANIGQHSHATHAHIRVRSNGGAVLVSIDDDGVGLPAGTPAPWTISAMVSELGGTMEMNSAGRGGAHLAITLPAS